MELTRAVLRDIRGPDSGLHLPRDGPAGRTPSTWSLPGFVRHGAEPYRYHESGRPHCGGVRGHDLPRLHGDPVDRRGPQRV